MTERAASSTALLVCQGRATADGRYAVGRFSDPIARELLDPADRIIVDRVRADRVPTEAADRMAYEVVRRTGLTMVPRTILIDDAIRNHAAGQLVILVAGLDAGPGECPSWPGPRCSSSTTRPRSRTSYAGSAASPRRPGRSSRRPSTWPANALVPPSLIQDQHTYEEWHAALLPLSASAAMEYEEGFGLYVVLQVNIDGAEEVRLHVPKLGVTSGLGDDYEWQSAQGQRIREVVWKAAVALKLMEPSAAR